MPSGALRAGSRSAVLEEAFEFGGGAVFSLSRSGFDADSALRIERFPLRKGQQRAIGFLAAKNEERPVAAAHDAPPPTPNDAQLRRKF